MSDYVENINSLSLLDKLEVYMHYYCTQLALKHNFYLCDKKSVTYKYGHGQPDKEFLGIGLSFLWKNIRIESFEEFISTANVVVSDKGEDWEKRGWAERYFTQYLGIYDWFWKFKDEFKFSNS